MKLTRKFGIALAGMVVLSLIFTCSDKKSPTDVTTHPEGWMDTSSPLFHGEKVMEDKGLTLCQSCHGQTLDDGGTSGVACTDCHNASKVESAQKHPERVQNLKWNLTSCQYCHNANFKGNGVSANCTTSNCHARPEGPKACVTCHGKFADTYASGTIPMHDIAPPADLYGETRPFSIGVGYHQFHLSRGVTCQACHANITSFDDPDHITGDGIAQLSDKFIKSWDRETATCTAVCHKVDGEFQPKVWTIE